MNHKNNNISLRKIVDWLQGGSAMQKKLIVEDDQFARGQLLLKYKSTWGKQVI